MKVRRKSEIAEAVLGADGLWEVRDPYFGKQYLNAKSFAAHYEPVPEPPAQIICNCDTEMFGTHCDWCPLFREICEGCAMPSPKHATGCPKTPSVSEEQPWPKENQVMKQELDPENCCGMPDCCLRRMPEIMRSMTEAEAKAKMESLRGENNGA